MNIDCSNFDEIVNLELWNKSNEEHCLRVKLIHYLFRHKLIIWINFSNTKVRWKFMYRFSTVINVVKKKTIWNEFEFLF